MEQISHSLAQFAHNFIKKPWSEKECTALSIALMVFSGLGAYRSTRIFTFSSIPSLFLPKVLESFYLKKHPKKLSQITALCRSIVVGAILGYWLNPEYIPLLNWQFPFFLLNSYIFGLWTQNLPLYSLGRFSPAGFLSEALYGYRDLDEEPKYMVYVTIFAIAAIISYLFPIISNFSTLLVGCLMGATIQTGKVNQNHIDRLVRGASLMILGASLGKISFCLLKNLEISKIDMVEPSLGLILLGGSYLNFKEISYTPVNLSDLTFTPTLLEKKIENRKANFDSLKERVEKLDEKTNFTLNPELKRIKDQQHAARYLLLIDENWNREHKRQNYMALLLCSAPDKNPENQSSIYEKVYEKVAKAGKILELS